MLPSLSAGQRNHFQITEDFRANVSNTQVYPHNGYNQQNQCNNGTVLCIQQRARYVGPDQLGNSVLGSGPLMTIYFGDGTRVCQFDFRAQFADAMS